MLKANNTTIKSNTIENKIKGAIKINAGSFIIDNQWVTYESSILRVEDYIRSKITANRPSFFNNRNYAVYLMVTLSLKEGIKILEGAQVKYTSREVVPIPSYTENIPLIGIVLRQDGTNDFSMGYTPLTDDDIFFYSGSGNIVTKNLEGVAGKDNTSMGLTGIQGYMGFTGIQGDTGLNGFAGVTGLTGSLIQGETGAQGMTGISWDVHLPFKQYTVV